MSDDGEIISTIDEYPTVVIQARVHGMLVTSNDIRVSPEIFDRPEGWAAIRQIAAIRHHRCVHRLYPEYIPDCPHSTAREKADYAKKQEEK